MTQWTCIITVKRIFMFHYVAPKPPAINVHSHDRLFLSHRCSCKNVYFRREQMTKIYSRYVVHLQGKWCTMQLQNKSVNPCVVPWSHLKSSTCWVFFFKRLTNQQLWKMCPGGNSVPLITKHGAISSIFFKAALINRVRTMISSFGHHIILLVFPL